MKKIIAILFTSILLGMSMNVSAKVDLKTCSVYYDGCNECSVFQGKIGGCTERMCIHQDTPKCLQKNTETRQDMFKKVLGEKSVEKIDNFVEKVLKKTEKMEHIQKERHLIKYVQKVEELRNKHIDKIENKKYKIYFMTLDYITYAFEQHIAYE